MREGKKEEVSVDSLGQDRSWTTPGMDEGRERTLQQVIVMITSAVSDIYHLQKTVISTTTTKKKSVEICVGTLLHVIVNSLLTP